MSSYPSFEYRPLSHRSDIRLLRVHPTTQFEDPILVSIEHHERLSSEAKELFDIDAAYQDATYTPEHDFTKTKKLSSDAHEDKSNGVAEIELKRLREGHEQYQRETMQSIGRRSSSTQSFYEAISYSWGTETATTSITVTCDKNVKYSLAVRNNIVTMLRYLRLNTHCRYFWIDFICINQSDITEKETQVRQMGSIYADAAKVLVWLGPEPDVERHICEDEDLFYSNITVMKDLIRRSWFQRRWILQEIALSLEAIVISGYRDLEFAQFSANADLTLRHLTPTICELTAEDIATLERMHTMGSLQLSFREWNTMDTYDRPYSLPNLMMLFSASKCYDDRDRLYALNSLTPYPVSITYRQPVEDIYYTFAVSEVQRDPMAMLSYAGACPSPSGSSPSWVPDWRVTPKYKPLSIEDNYDNLSAEVDYSQQVKVDRNKGTLIIHAAHVATVRTACSGSTGQAWYEFFLSHYSPTPFPLKEGIHVFMQNYSSKHHEDDESLAIHNLLLRNDSELDDIFAQSERDPEPAGSASRKQRELGHTDLMNIRGIVPGRNCFFTETGEFGRGPAGLQSGDVIVSMAGRRTTYIALRPAPESASSVSGVVGSLARLDIENADPSAHVVASEPMTVLGDCWIHDIMVKRETVLPDELQSFTIR